MFKVANVAGHAEPRLLRVFIMDLGHTRFSAKTVPISSGGKQHPERRNSKGCLRLFDVCVQMLS